MAKRGMYYKSHPPYPKFYPGDAVGIVGGRYKGEIGLVKGMYQPYYEETEWDYETHRRRPSGRHLRRSSTGVWEVYLPELDKIVNVKSTNLTLEEAGFGAGDPRLRYPYSKARIVEEAVDVPRSTIEYEEGGTRWRYRDLPPEELRERAALAREMARRFKASEGYYTAAFLEQRAETGERLGDRFLGEV